LHTFNANWNEALYDIKDLANEGFFFSFNQQQQYPMFLMWCDPTKFLSNTSSFIIHLLASPNCKYLIKSDETNKTDGTYRSTQLRNIGTSKDFQETTPEIRLNHMIKQAGFTSITNLHETYYK